MRLSSCLMRITPSRLKSGDLSEPFIRKAYALMALGVDVYYHATCFSGIYYHIMPVSGAHLGKTRGGGVII